MVPFPGLRPHLPGRRPDSATSSFGRQPPGLEAPQHRGPRLGRLAEARRHGEDFLGAVGHGSDHDQQGRLVQARSHRSRRPRRRPAPGPRASGAPTRRAPRPTAPAGGAPWTSTAAPRRPADPAGPTRSPPRPGRRYSCTTSSAPVRTGGSLRTSGTVPHSIESSVSDPPPTICSSVSHRSDFHLLPCVASFMRRRSFPGVSSRVNCQLIDQSVSPPPHGDPSVPKWENESCERPRWFLSCSTSSWQRL